MNNPVINIDTWNNKRELSFCPKHFVKATTPLTMNSKLWVLEKLHGRFYLETSDKIRFFGAPTLFEDQVIYFEDPREAVFYELAWS